VNLSRSSIESAARKAAARTQWFASVFDKSLFSRLASSVSLAALYEVARRMASTDDWVNFKVFGILPLTLVFALAQAPLMMRHEIRAEEEDPEAHF